VDDILTVNDLSFAYSDGQQALDGITLNVCRGETVALIGPNGAGKSTLLLHLNGILRSNGAVRVLDRPLDDDNLKWVRGKVGLVFQNPDDQLFSPTVYEDVAFGPVNMGCGHDEVDECVARALKWVGMAGYEGRSPHHLSAGEKKRISLATVLAMSPEVLVLDEPASNLDPEGKWSLIGLLKKLPMTKIIASHDLELVRALASRIVILDKGRVVADGDAGSILNDAALLAAHRLAPPHKD